MMYGDDYTCRQGLAVDDFPCFRDHTTVSFSSFPLKFSLQAGIIIELMAMDEG